MENQSRFSNVPHSPSLPCCPCHFLPHQVVAVYKDDGERGHHMQDYIPKEELAKFLAKCGDNQLQQQVRLVLDVVQYSLSRGKPPGSAHRVTAVIVGR